MDEDDAGALTLLRTALSLSVPQRPAPPRESDKAEETTARFAHYDAHQGRDDPVPYPYEHADDPATAAIQPTNFSYSSTTLHRKFNSSSVAVQVIRADLQHLLTDIATYLTTNRCETHWLASVVTFHEPTRFLLDVTVHGRAAPLPAE